MYNFLAYLSWQTLTHNTCPAQVHVEFLDAGDTIKVEGPPDEADRARELLENQVRDLVANTTYIELNVDSKYHKHIIGKGGSTGEISL